MNQSYRINEAIEYIADDGITYQIEVEGEKYVNYAGRVFNDIHSITVTDCLGDDVDVTDEIREMVEDYNFTVEIHETDNDFYEDIAVGF